MPKSREEKNEDVSVELKEPSMFRVILLNDDYTTMEFVVDVLKEVFHKQTEEAEQIMLEIHTRGRGIAGVYTFEIAETKQILVRQMARDAGFPLRCITEEV